MSRGHGIVQRRVLEQLRANTADPLADEQDRTFWNRLAAGSFQSWTRSVDLAGENPTPSQIESTRRALHKLADSGLVQLDWISRQIPGKWSWNGMMTRNYLVARMTPDPEVQKEIEANREQKRAEHEAWMEAKRQERNAERIAQGLPPLLQAKLKPKPKSEAQSGEESPTALAESIAEEFGKLAKSLPRQRKSS